MNALWGLLDTLYERVKGEWEERFERRYGFWRGLADEVAAKATAAIKVMVLVPDSRRRVPTRSPRKLE